MATRIIVIEPDTEAMRVLHRSVARAVERGRKVSLAVDEGDFKVKVGEDIWTHGLDTGQPTLPGF